MTRSPGPRYEMAAVGWLSQQYEKPYLSIVKFSKFYLYFSFLQIHPFFKIGRKIIKKVKICISANKCIVRE